MALAIFVAFAQGCGGDDSPPAPSTGAATTQPDLAPAVSEAEVGQYKSGTPQHTALEWWRAVQLNDPEQALTLYAEPPTLPNLAGQLNFVEGQLAGTVKVASVKRKGEQGVVTIAWDKPGAPPRRVTIGMEQVGGEWKIVTVRFLDQIVEKMQEAEADATAPPSG